MSQLDKVLRRSVAHIAPSDPEGRERVFASARQAMIRLLHVYDPPLTSYEIDSKIREFDDVIDQIELEFRWARPLALPEPAAISAPPAPRWNPPALPPPAPLWPEAEPETDEEPEEEAAEEAGEALDDDYADDPYDDDEDYEAEDGDEDELYYDEEYEPRNRVLDWIDAIGWRTLAAAAIAVVLLGSLGAALLLHGRKPATSETNAVQTAAAPSPAAAPAEPQAAAAEPVVQPAATPEAPRATPAAGDLALETLVLFDGRDPSIFQSAPENPVSFQGDAEGGFARISSSTGSTGARVQVGRGVYERIAGHTIRIVIVARAARTAPATGIRFAYQNGRILSPWTDAPLGATYAPLSAIWTAPKERGGPENDSLIIEPGVPGDGTATDIRSVRLEILN